MYEGNPGEIDFGSSKREVRVSEGFSCRKSTVYLIGGYFRLLLHISCLKKGS